MVFLDLQYCLTTCQKKCFTISAIQQVGYIEIALFLTKQLHVSALKTKLS